MCVRLCVFVCVCMCVASLRERERERDMCSCLDTNCGESKYGIVSGKLSKTFGEQGDRNYSTN